MAYENEQQGAVKRVFYTKGFGFITGDDDREYFFHVYETRANFERLTTGDRVKFFAQTSSYVTHERCCKRMPKEGCTGEVKEGFKAVRVRSC